MTEPSDITRALRAGIGTDTSAGAVIPPIHLSTTYTFAGFNEPRAHDYARATNPTRELLADAIVTLEGGAGGIVCASGMGAITTVLLAMLKVGDSIAIPHDCYGGSWRLFHRMAERGNFTVHTIDFTDTETACESIRRLAPTVVWLETPSNPLLRITDLEPIIATSQEVGAKTVVDNTFLTPVLQRPLAMGADIVVHSTTKYLNGHSDVIGGAVVARRAEDAELCDFWAKTAGTMGTAFDSWLVLRGMRTLPVRMRAHEAGASAVAAALREHPAVRTVHYPGLPDHPGHEIAARQQGGFGGMVSFELFGEAEVRAFIDGLQCFSLAESLGGTESLVSHPVTMTHASMSPEALAKAGLSGGLLRLSVGLEDPADLIADLQAGLERVTGL
ncbi:cystathionine gamma-synthase [Granulicoccus sp. GXG6511]|uniref:cystathionine gamma-synthase n=1 Tax=Granulicoccus sp. GXG6511 TaxID=3381351 RepID=UPI003D7E67E4